MDGQDGLDGLQAAAALCASLHKHGRGMAIWRHGPAGGLSTPGPVANQASNPDLVGCRRPHFPRTLIRGGDRGLRPCPRVTSSPTSLRSSPKRGGWHGLLGLLGATLLSAHACPGSLRTAFSCSKSGADIHTFGPSGGMDDSSSSIEYLSYGGFPADDSPAAKHHQSPRPLARSDVLQLLPLSACLSILPYRHGATACLPGVPKS